jgi:hypothetical protein
MNEKDETSSHGFTTNRASWDSHSRKQLGGAGIHQQVAARHQLRHIRSRAVLLFVFGLAAAAGRCKAQMPVLLGASASGPLLVQKVGRLFDERPICDGADPDQWVVFCRLGGGRAVRVTAAAAGGSVVVHGDPSTLGEVRDTDSGRRENIMTFFR